MDERHVSQQLERIREQRVRSGPDQSAKALFDATARQYAKLERSLSGAAGAWAEQCPPELLERTSVHKCERGVLEIGVRDSATRYEVDRFLRSGGQRAVIRACPTSIRRIKLVGEARTSAGAGR